MALFNMSRRFNTAKPSDEGCREIKLPVFVFCFMIRSTYRDADYRTQVSLFNSAWILFITGSLPFGNDLFANVTFISQGQAGKKVVRELQHKINFCFP